MRNAAKVFALILILFMLSSCNSVSEARAFKLLGFPEKTESLISTAIAQPTRGSKVVFINTCFVVTDSTTGFPSGSLLYRTIPNATTWGRGLRSASAENPLVLLENTYSTSISPNGESLAYYKDEQNVLQLWNYNLNTHEENLISSDERLGSGIIWEGDDPGIYLDQRESDGTITTTQLFFINDSKTISKTDTLILPDYTLGITNNVFDDFLSISTSRLFALYVANPLNNGTSVITLLNLQTQEILWQSIPTASSINVASPWIEDASVVYAISVFVEGSNRSVIYHIDAKGNQHELLDFHTLDLEKEGDYLVSSLSWSSSGKHLLLSLLNGNTYIYNVKQRTLRLLCDSSDSNTNLLSIRWIPHNDWLVYAYNTGDGSSSLSLVDVEAWEAHTLIENSYDMEILGWTPLDITKQ